jgi:HTH-type transcriptional regulator / antitoxin HigA
MATNQYNPDYVIHPGEYIAEILESREIKKRDLAERIGLSVKAVSQIINGKALYSPDVALMLEKALQVDARIWINLVEAYQLHHAREKERRNLETKQTREWVRRFPTADLKRLGFLEKTTKAEVNADQLLRFFQVASPDVWDEYMEKQVASYRKSSAFSESPEAIAVWLRLAGIDAEKVETQPYDRNAFRGLLPDLRSLTVTPPDHFLSEIAELCSAVGVAFVLVPELKGTHISGAAFWLSSQKATIAVSLRYRTNDHFWFTFFHEVAHVYLHGKKAVFIDGEEETSAREEEEANAFAGEFLIPKREYAAFTQREAFFPEAIQEFAERIGLHPGIVVGRLQHDGLIQYKWHNQLKEKIDAP